MATLTDLFWLWVALIEGKGGPAITNIVTIATGVAIASAFVPVIRLGERYFNRSAR